MALRTRLLAVPLAAAVLVAPMAADAQGYRYGYGYRGWHGYGGYHGYRYGYGPGPFIGGALLGLGVGAGLGGYYAPRAYYPPPPVYYAPPPVYYAPPPAYYAPPAYVVPRPYVR